MNRYINHSAKMIGSWIAWIELGLSFRGFRGLMNIYVNPFMPQAPLNKCCLGLCYFWKIYISVTKIRCETMKE